MESDRPQPDPPPDADGSPAGEAGGDRRDVLSAVDEHFVRLRQIQAEQDAASVALDERTMIVQEAEEALGKREAAVVERERRLAEDRLHLETNGGDAEEATAETVPGGTAAENETLETLRAALAAAEEQRAALEEEVGELRNASGGAPPTPGADGAGSMRVRAMQQRINKLEKELALRSKAPLPLPPTAPPPPTPAVDPAAVDKLRRQAGQLAVVAEHVKRRQGRLRRMRKLLREQAAQGTSSVRARERDERAVLERERHAKQLRHLDEQRTEFNERRIELAKAERRMRRRWARARGTVLTGWIALVVAVSAGLGWLATERLAPAVRSATLLVEADVIDREELDPELSSRWQTWHAGLLQDAAFRQQLARRMHERRLEPWGIADELRHRLETDLTVDTGEIGRLRFTVSGTNRDDLTAFLDIMGSAITSESRRSVDQRADGMVATLAGGRTIDGRTVYGHVNAVPVEDDRLAWFGPIAGAIFFALVAIGVYLYRNLLQAALEIDEDGTLFSDAPTVATI